MWDNLSRYATSTANKVKKRPVVSHNGLYAMVLDYIADHPGCRARQIRLALGLNTLNLQWALRSMEKQGYILSLIRPVAKRVDKEATEAKHFWAT